MDDQDREEFAETSKQVLKKRRSETEVTRAAGGDFSRRGSKRIKEKRDKELEQRRAQLPEGMGHFGLDATPFVQEAMGEGGKLDKSEREKLSQQMKGSMLTGDSLDQVLPKSFVPQVASTFKKRSVSQVDVRDESSKRRESYSGFMFTSSFVNPDPFTDPKEKEIPRPSSPRPEEYGKGEAHQSHAAPFSLIGPESNRFKTVWNSQWANIGVDSRIEKNALAEHGKGSEVVHFRYDTDSHSTVGLVSKTPSGTFSSQTMQYQRRGGDKEHK